MLLLDFFASGKYADFILLDDEVYLLPPGFVVGPEPVETSTVKTMASGRRRRDLVGLKYKYKFSWATATQQMLGRIQDTFNASLDATVLKLYLRKEDPVAASDYYITTLSLVSPVAYKPLTRPSGRFLYQNVSLEVE